MGDLPPRKDKRPSYDAYYAQGILKAHLDVQEREFSALCCCYFPFVRKRKCGETKEMEICAGIEGMRLFSHKIVL